MKKDPQISSEDRTYIDFIINGISLSELLGGVGVNIGKFGWTMNKEFELGEFNDFRTAKKSRLENGLFSAYVCAECGDEGCGAVMFQIEKIGNIVKWTNFIWSDGYTVTEIGPDDEINIEPIVFDVKEYEMSLSKLKKMIIEK